MPYGEGEGFANHVGVWSREGVDNKQILLHVLHDPLPRCQLEARDGAQEEALDKKKGTITTMKQWPSHSVYHTVARAQTT